MPIVPGLVSDSVVPAKSSTVSAPVLAFRTMSSYADQNCAKSKFSHPLIEGTNNCRYPSAFGKSIAIPKLICSGCPIAGFPSNSVKKAFISGMALAALIIAYPIR